MQAELRKSPNKGVPGEDIPGQECSVGTQEGDRPGSERDLARVLLVDDNLTSRLTLQAILEAGGYFVDSAASAAEALGKLDLRQYELVVSDLQMEAPEVSLNVLAYARGMEYKPATAILTTYTSNLPERGVPVLIEPQDLPSLLSKVADLISQRAARIVARQLRSV